MLNQALWGLSRARLAVAVSCLKATTSAYAYRFACELEGRPRSVRSVTSRGQGPTFCSLGVPDAAGSFVLFKTSLSSYCVTCAGLAAGRWFNLRHTHLSSTDPRPSRYASQVACVSIDWHRCMNRTPPPGGVSEPSAVFRHFSHGWAEAVPHTDSAQFATDRLDRAAYLPAWSDIISKLKLIDFRR